MSFAVSWRPEPERKLTTIWLSASDRDSVTEAVARLEDDLRHDPLTTGESRELFQRVAFCRPLGIKFAVDQIRGGVYVIDIWRV